MLRLVIDTDGIDSESDPKVVYLGHSASAAQSAIDESESSKLSIVEIPWLRRAKKSPVVEPPEEETAENPDGLDKFTIDELKELMDDEGIEHAGAHLRQDYIDITRLYRQLDEAHTVDALKEVAAAEEVEVEGKLKRDYLNAIVAKRRLQNFP